MPSPIINSFSLTSTISDNGENVREYVDDVQVESEGREDIFLGWDGELVVPSYHELCVKHQVEGEEQGTHARVYDVQDPILEDDGQDTEHYEHNERHPYEHATSCEVNFCLESEESKWECHHHTNAHSHQDLHLVESSSCNAQQEAFTHRKQPQEDVIVGCPPPKTSTAGESYDANQSAD